MKRRTFLRRTAVLVTGLATSQAIRAADSAGLPSIRINPTPRHELSRHLYMQFMEPLGATDGSVEAA